MAFWNKPTPAPLPSPEGCKVQILKISTEIRTTETTQLVPDKQSEEYQKAVNAGVGTFSKSEYSANKGEWHEEKSVNKVPVTIGEFTCRKTMANDIPPMRTTGSIEGITKITYDTIGGLYCKTCPYFGKTALEAAQYDLAVAQAETEAAEAAKFQQEALRELSAFHRPPELPAGNE